MIGHLVQSTVFAALAGLLTLALRKNHARARHWLWFAASVKFLIPFAWLVAIGTHVGPSVAPAVSNSRGPVAIEEMAQTLPVRAAPAHIPEYRVQPLLQGIWLSVTISIVVLWTARWRRMHAMVRAAAPMDLDLPHGIEVRSAPTLMEPGVFGILRPVLLLPAGIAERLTPLQLRAIVSHEICHIRRRDNLTSAIHMAVEAIFWFHPLVWWLGARLVEERERACDEEVLRAGSSPQVYAEGILNVCKFYLESPLACASGVTGADLKKRIESIMSSRLSPGLTPAGKLLLAAAGMMSVAVPVVIGIMNQPPGRAQSQESVMAFEVAAVKPAASDARGLIIQFTPGGGIRIVNVSLKGIVQFAYGVEKFQVAGGPGWIDSDRFDILAKPPAAGGGGTGEATREQRAQALQRLQTLLQERFHVAIRRDSREAPVYALTVGRNGHKLKESTQGFDGISGRPGQLMAEKASLDGLAAYLSGQLGRPVIDRTGLVGAYAFQLEWTPNIADRSEGAREKAESVGAALPDGSGPSIFTALQEQLGLRLESQRGPIETIVIESASKPEAN